MHAVKRIRSRARAGLGAKEGEVLEENEEEEEEEEETGTGAGEDEDAGGEALVSAAGLARSTLAPSCATISGAGSEGVEDGAAESPGRMLEGGTAGTPPSATAEDGPGDGPDGGLGGPLGG